MRALTFTGAGLVCFLALTGSSLSADTRAAVGTNAASPCAVTLPNGTTAPSQVKSPYGYRHGTLWVELWPYGVTLVGKSDITSDGWLAVKVPWYRFGKGTLKIAATRLDKPARPARADVPSGYGNSGFQASSIYFPSEGCWKITGTVGHTKLTYVTIVLTTKTVHQEAPNG
jgi:hypothetical protein